MILIVACAVMCLAAIVQRITGLGFALVATPPMVLLTDAIEGVLITLLMSVLVSMAMGVGLWRDIDWRRSTVLVLAGALVAIPAAWVVTVFSPSWLMILIGAAALLSLLAGHLIRGSGSPLGLRSAGVAGAAAGFLHVTSGLSGPPLVIYGLRSSWAQQSFVASLQVVFVAYGVIAIGLRGLPAMGSTELGVLALLVLTGLGIGTIAVRRIPVRIARLAMLSVAWAGATTVLARGTVSLLV